MAGRRTPESTTIQEVVTYVHEKQEIDTGREGKKEGCAGSAAGDSHGRFPQLARRSASQPRILPRLSNCLARCGRGRFRVREHLFRPGPTFPSGFSRTKAKLNARRAGLHWAPGEAEILARRGALTNTVASRAPHSPSGP